MFQLITIGVVVLAAAAGKIRDGISAFGAELSELLGLPPPLRSVIAAALVVGEFCWVIVLFVSPIVGAGVSLVALAVLSGVAGRAWRRGRRDCLCFGAGVRSSPRTAVLRNCLLMALAATVSVVGPTVLVSPVVDVALGLVLGLALVRIEELVNAIRVVVGGSPTGAAS